MIVLLDGINHVFCDPDGLEAEPPRRRSSLVAQPEFRRDFAVQIDGYGAGRNSLLVG